MEINEEIGEINQLPLFITDNDDSKRDYVFKECQIMINSYNTVNKIYEQKLEKFKENEFEIILRDPFYIIITFIENDKEQILITTCNIRKVTIKYLQGEDKKFWLVNETILTYYLKKLNLIYPIFNINSLDFTLNEDNYETFILSNCIIINESDKPNINFDEIKKNLNQNKFFSDITLQNKKYFKNSYNQNNLDDKLTTNSYKINKLIQMIHETKFKELKIIKNSKSGFSSLLYSNLKLLKKNY